MSDLRLKDWENWFEYRILQRGLDLFEEKCVRNVELNGNTYTAVVEGTYDYDVSIEAGTDGIQDMYCTCPYAESGRFCKHEAALLYAVCDGEDSEDNTTKWEKRFYQKSDELSQAILQIPIEKLQSMVQSYALQDDTLYNRIMTDYATESIEKKIARAKNRIDQIRYEYSDRRGFIDWRNAGGFISSMTGVLYDNVDALINREEWMAAFDVTKEVFITIGNVDIDDDGDLTYGAETCCEFWRRIVNGCSDEERQTIYNWFAENKDSEMVIDYLVDYINDFFLNEFHDRKALENKITILDQKIVDYEENERSSWYYREYEELVLNRLLTMEELKYSQDEIDHYIHKHYSISGVRQHLVDHLVQEEKIQEAIEILQESKIMDARYHGLVQMFSEKLIRMYEQLGDRKSMLSEVEFQVLSCPQNNLKYILMWKEMIEPSEWSERVLEKILAADSCRMVHFELLQAEGMYERLLHDVLETESIFWIDQYEKVLKEKFPNEMKKAYIAYVQTEAKRVTQRKYYRQLAGYLKKIRKYPGGTDDAQAVADEWKREYRRRSAMMDELAKAGF